jgi:hypothetical protein
MTDAELAEIEARANAARPGPWKVGGYDDTVESESYTGPDHPVLADMVPPLDAEFIAHARSDVPALIAEVRRLGGVVDEYKEVIEAHHADFRAVKVQAAKGLQCPTALDCPAQVEWTRRALTEIDRIVR